MTSLITLSLIVSGSLDSLPAVQIAPPTLLTSYNALMPSCQVGKKNPQIALRVSLLFSGFLKQLGTLFRVGLPGVKGSLYNVGFLPKDGTLKRFGFLA